MLTITEFGNKGQLCLVSLNLSLRGSTVRLDTSASVLCFKDIEKKELEEKD